MKSKNDVIFGFLKAKLMEWKPKETATGQAGVGYDETNILDTLSVLPTHNPFDMATFVSGTRSDILGDISRNKVTHSTQTFLIDYYGRRLGVGREADQVSKKALHENADKLIEIMASVGFNATNPTYDLNFSGNGTVRASIFFSRTFSI